MEAAFRAPRGVGGELAPPPDKSITHRALMLAALGSGESRIRAPLETGDCLSTLRCLAALGCPFERADGALVARGLGIRGFREPREPLDAENSGTTTRLLAGLIAGLPLFAVLTGDASLRQRPMARVIEPLVRMGARIEGREGGRFLPVCFLPGSGSLAAIDVVLPIASAQVKSAILFAGFRAEGRTTIGGRIGSRDHTERMLGALGVPLRVESGRISIEPVSSIPSFDMRVPGDVSSAAFFIAAAAISGRELVVRGCGVNPTRLGLLEVLGRMGVRIEASEERRELGEPVGTIRVSPGALRGTTVSPEEVPDLIDEIPLLAVLGLFSRGVTVVRGAAELRNKESDRLAGIAAMAASLGGEVELFDDGFAIQGPQELRPGTVDPAGDHRIAMSAAVAAAGIRGGVAVRGFECARVSYPDFAEDFRRLGGEVS
jgi:3-phosphoshikimate 1-carboxyvinyltransferase